MCLEAGFLCQINKGDLLVVSRGKKLALNTLTSLFLQIITIVCGFILPRLILGTFGSDVNGLVNSIAQFLGVISLLDLGVGAVVQSSLYKPLADGDKEGISKIYVSATRFFRRLATIFVAYVVVLMGLYPLIAKNSFDFSYNVTLIGAMCISSFAQYYFGIVNSLLLTAHQKGYISYTLSIVTLILNTIACTILIKCGATIQIVKLTTSLIFMAKPLFLYYYVSSHYSINKKITYTDEPIKQKWNGMAQHFAAFVLGGTDNIVLTVFSTLSNVSIYSVYNIVIMGVKNALLSMTGGFQSLIGDMLAKKETEKLNKFFGYVEWVLHTGTTLVFGCTGVLLVSFVRVYTSGIDDADYIQPLFAILITVANAGHCLRLPYNVLILAAGHYKQTQINYIIAMFLNIIISIATVSVFGLVGVAIGTLIAMFYQTIWMAWYNSKNIINWPFKKFLKQCGVDALTVIFASVATFKIPMLAVSYKAWFLLAIEVFVVWLVITIAFNLIFYRDNLKTISAKLSSKILKKRCNI